MPVHNASLIILSIFVGLVLSRLLWNRWRTKRSPEEERRRAAREHWLSNRPEEDSHPNN